MSGRSRLLTPLAVGVVVLAAIGLVIWATLGGSTMFSPGGLNAEAKAEAVGGVNSHAELNDDCGQCHPAPWSASSMADLCIACHQDVGEQVGGRTGLHGAFVGSGPGEDCRGCHTEHKGPMASLTLLDASFPHEGTGFSLRAHSSEGIACADCHEQDLLTFDQQACVDCHTGRDAGFMTQHVEAFGSECVPCHDGVDRYGESFDHNKLAFTLTGGHTDLACSVCHADATSVVALQQTPQDCFSCHEQDDAHGGDFGHQCGGCHSVDGWADATFDHSQTGFPLTGAHLQVACDTCHEGGAFSGTPTDCVSCHPQPDFHKDAFGDRSTQCADCHTAEAWTPAEFDEAHAAFPIDHGREERQPTCMTCHPTDVASYTCFGCHEHTQDNVVREHEGRTLAELEDCVRCHEGGRGGD